MSEEEVQVDLREKWPNEALNFTPWLAKHLDLLGEAVGLKLEAVGEEHQVGSFSLDILAWEANEKVRVAIENQLEWTDHGHRGQLILYAAGTRAGIAIWVADEFQYEHAEALHQLNQWADGKIKFYGVKVDLIKSGDGCLQPWLQTVVRPDFWNRELTLPPNPINPEIQKYEDFFGPLANKVLECGFANTCSRAFNHRDRFFPSDCDPDSGYGVSLGGGEGAWVYCLVRTWESVDLSNRLFDALQKEQQQIESSFEAQGEWFWKRYDPFSFCIIGIRQGGSIDDSPEELEKTRAWMLDLLPRFKEAFEERTARLLSELRGQEAATPQTRNPVTK